MSKDVNTLVKWRLNAGYMTRQDLAMAVGLSPATIGNVERGSDCSERTAILLGEVFGVEAETVIAEFQKLVARKYGWTNAAPATQERGEDTLHESTP